MPKYIEYLGISSYLAISFLLLAHVSPIPTNQAFVNEKQLVNIDIEHIIILFSFS